MKKAKRNSVIGRPKQVLPTAVKTHGLMGLPYLRHHMMEDERWTVGCLTEQFKGMASFYEKRRKFQEHEGKWISKRNKKEYRKLKRLCRDGRLKLWQKTNDESANEIRKFLRNHKDMQRLFQGMPIHVVAEAMNQRSFVMSKERDRLIYKMESLKEKYRGQLMQSSMLENRIKYREVYELEEEKKSRHFRKLIENARIRLIATKTINETYKKMLEVLRNEEIFYDPIIRSLNKDLDDQAIFIKNVLYRGIPAQLKSKELSEEYRQVEEKTRRNSQTKAQFITEYRKEVIKRFSEAALNRANKPVDQKDIRKRYVRDTDSMKFLKNELESIEGTIKHVKFATLCSQAKEIFPRMRVQVNNNQLLMKIIENGKLRHQSLNSRQKRAEVLEGMLINNLSEDEIHRAETIKILQEDIEREDEFEAKTMEQMKERGNVIVLLTFTLWNLNEILRYIGRVPKIVRYKYANSYLKLPLLKFEMLNMHSFPPEPYEENIATILHLVKYKLYRLMRAYTKEQSPYHIQACRDEYHAIFLESVDYEDKGEGTEGHHGKAAVGHAVPEEVDAKLLHSVPDRAHIKMRSAKMVEENVKKED